MAGVIFPASAVPVSTAPAGACVTKIMDARCPYVTPPSSRPRTTPVILSSTALIGLYAES
jgi:hypothetical protein